MSQSNFVYKKKTYNETLKVPLLKRLIRQNCRSNNVFVCKTKSKKIALNPRNINFELVTIFYTVVLLGSLKLAAENLGMSQPALTLSLQKLEREVGCLLFNHSHPQNLLKLTPQGIIIFNYFNRCFQVIEDSFNFSVSLNYEKKQIHKKFLEKIALVSEIKSVNNYFGKNNNIINSPKTFQIFSFYSFYKFVNSKHCLALKTKPYKSLKIFSKNLKSYKKKQYLLGHFAIKSTEIYTKKGFQLALKLKISDFFYINS